MSNPLSEADQPLDSVAARLAAKVRWLMLISALTTVIAVGAILAVIGYRVFKAEGSAAAADVSVVLPKGARILSATAAEGRIAVTLQTADGIEIRTFDLKSLKPVGRLQLTAEP